MLSLSIPTKLILYSTSSINFLRELMANVLIAVLSIISPSLIKTIYLFGDIKLLLCLSGNSKQSNNILN